MNGLLPLLWAERMWLVDGTCGAGRKHGAGRQEGRVEMPLPYLQTAPARTRVPRLRAGAQGNGRAAGRRKGCDWRSRGKEVQLHLMPDGWDPREKFIETKAKCRKETSVCALQSSP